MTTKPHEIPDALVNECICLHTRRAARLLSRHYDEAFAPLGLTNGQYATLRILAHNKRIGLQELAERLVMDRTTLTAAMKPLERRNLVAITPDPRDRRARLIALTPAGTALLKRATSVWKEVQVSVAARLGVAEVATLLDGLRSVSALRTYSDQHDEAERSA